ncbi:hypothetical protein VOI54_13915 [Tamlana sp. 2201CG12-4]|uniref:hypothetical protein n=1 Tax=Tamlana sp. 2201CG12-4 TaxID=3112582 RepID=UPI002DB76EA8|nr:hypothetical protein [Tamlana sp. 2201CG12-4]MEC3908122.1 hypothetical protein [Tamlana sp. 2201CG12-4]
MTRTIILLATLCTLSLEVQAQNESLNDINTLQEFVSIARKGQWKEVKYKKGVSLNYRNLVVSDTIETRELSAKFKLQFSNIDSIVSHIKQPKHVRLWNDGVRDVNLLKNGVTNWISHTTYDIPFPFKQQDLVTHSTITQKHNTIILSSKSLPDFIEPQKGVTREGYNLSEWRLTTSENGTIEVEFYAVSLTKSNIPRFVRDPIIQRKLINSFINLKERLL